MKHSIQFSLCLLFILSFILPASADQASTMPSGPELDAALTARAKELAPMLSDHFCVLPGIEDRAFWEGGVMAAQGPNLVRQAEKELQSPVMQIPDELYLEFSQNGNRSHYQNALGKRNAPLGRLVLAECYENKGRFIPRIEEHLRAYFADKSWTLPAHDSSLNDFYGKETIIDLASSATAWHLATVGAILGDKLSPEVRAELKAQLEDRCFVPFRQHINTGQPKFWWVRNVNNWNAVCLAGVTGAALTGIESKEERAWFLAAAEKFIQNSNEGYTADGYCTEGVGYWCYGFGNHIRLSETVRRATSGKIQILNQEKLRTVAIYGFTISILPGIAPSFADCGMNASPSPYLLAFLNRYYGFHLDGYDYALPVFTHNLNDFGIFGMNLPPLPAAGERGMATVGGGTPAIGNRTWFDSAGIMIYRPEGWKAALENLQNAKETAASVKALDGFACAMKGGSNGEAHNHNDVGSYVVVYHRTFPALDLGGEVYTRRTFSRDRYVSDVLNSWGHNVPVVAGKLQKSGAKYKATVLDVTSTPETESLKIDIAAAYDLPEVEALTREFVYSRDKVQFVVKDAVKFTSPQKFETALVTIESWKREGNAVIFGEGDDAVRAEIEVTADGKPSNDWTLTEGTYEADFAANKIARRLGIVLNAEVKEATVTVTYRP